MKKITLFISFLFVSILTFSQTTINITTSGGNYASEKWVNVTTEVDGGGTQVWGQGDGTYGNGQGLIDVDISLDPGTYYVNAYDRYSDGWDGTQLLVTLLDGTVLASADSPSDSSTVDSTGSWETPADELEGSYEIVVPEDTTITFSATATTGIGSATFSFTANNFTVGSPNDTGVDGHIHYSLNGGDTVMIYSSDDLTLNDLPNGDHTIVFELVDNNHTSLDPAVTSTVNFSTMNACGETVTYTQVANGDYTVGAAAGSGEVASVTVSATMETNYDYLYVRDGAGNLLNDGSTTGSIDATYESTDGTISVNVTNDGSVQNGDVTLVFTCATSSAAVTFTVNTANITVGDNGMYLAGGVITDTFGGGAQAVAMTDADSDGTWEVTVDLPIGTTGNYIFLNSPSNDGDWGAKEVLTGQECADPSSYDDRILAEITGDVTLQHCFGSCETDGTCPAAGTFYDVTFTVNMASYDNAADLSSGVYLNGEFNGWCGDCNQMTDNGDGTYSIVMNLEEGDYRFKFTVGGWTDQEYFDGSESCTNTNDAGYTDRVITVDAEGIVYEVCFELCPGESCSPAAALELQGIIDFTVPSGGSDGKAIHVVANSDIADLSIYGIGVANNGGGTDGEEYNFDAISVSAGDHILVARSIDAMNSYMDASTIFNHVLEATSYISQNGDDAIELFENGSVIETFGDIDTDGTGQDWEYTDSWAYKVDGAWTYGGVNCTDNTTTICDSTCIYPLAVCDTSGDVIAFLGSGNWRVQAEEGGHMGVGPGTAYWAEWWNANPWDKAATGLYDDGWTFSADGVMTHDTGDDGAIFGKKDAIDGAWPDNTPYDADNADGEYEYYTLADYTDTYTVDTTSGDYDTVTLGSNGTIGFHTATAAQEYQILETGDGYVYFRNVGFDGNSWYGKFTTADYLSTNDSQILDMRIYPNPVDGNYVTILSPVNGIKDIQIFDINGRMVMDTAINNNTLDVSSINSGFYMIKVTIDGQSKVSKLVVR